MVSALMFALMSGCQRAAEASGSWRVSNEVHLLPRQSFKIQEPNGLVVAQRFGLGNRERSPGQKGDRHGRLAKLLGSGLIGPEPVPSCRPSRKSASRRQALFPLSLGAFKSAMQAIHIGAISYQSSSSSSRTPSSSICVACSIICWRSPSRSSANDPAGMASSNRVAAIGFSSSRR